MTGAHSKLTPKRQAGTMWAGQGYRRASGYDKTNNMTRPKDLLDKLLIEDVEATRWDWVLLQRRQDAQLE